MESNFHGEPIKHWHKRLYDLNRPDPTFGTNESIGRLCLLTHVADYVLAFACHLSEEDYAEIAHLKRKLEYGPFYSPRLSRLPFLLSLSEEHVRELMNDAAYNAGVNEVNSFFSKPITLIPYEQYGLMRMKESDNEA